MIAPPTPTQTPMIVFFVPVDIPFEALLLSAESVATFVDVEVEVLLETLVEEMTLPSLVVTTTVVTTLTLVVSLREVDSVTLEEELLESIVVVELEESEVEVTELLCVELGDVVEAGVEVVEVGESLVDVAEVLAGEVVLGAAPSTDDKPLNPVLTSESTSERPSCLLF